MKRLIFMMLICAFLINIPNVMAMTILLDDNFDSENGSVGIENYIGFANWNVTKGGVDLSGNGIWDWLPGNGLYVDLDGSTTDAGMLVSKTTFTLSPGNYELLFSLAGSQRGETNSVKVRLGNIFNEIFTLDSNVPFTTITRNLSISTPTTGTLSFEHMGVVDWAGLLLDNVTLAKEDSVPVPEAGTIILLTCSLAGFAVWIAKQWLTQVRVMKK